MNIEDLWDKFHQPLKTYISHRVNDQFIVDDLLQIVFMKIQVHLPNLIVEQKIDSWIYRITRNTIINFYRTKKQAK
jgi:RNA polymerase sigma-70 factor (ECF subfamily)